MKTFTTNLCIQILHTIIFEKQKWTFSKKGFSYVLNLVWKPLWKPLYVWKLKLLSDISTVQHLDPLLHQNLTKYFVLYINIVWPLCIRDFISLWMEPFNNDLSYFTYDQSWNPCSGEFIHIDFCRVLTILTLFRKVNGTPRFLPLNEGMNLDPLASPSSTRVVPIVSQSHCEHAPWRHSLTPLRN